MRERSLFIYRLQYDTIMRVISKQQLLRSSKSFRHALDTILTALYKHDRNTRDLPYTPLKVSIAGRHDIAAMLLASM